MFCRKYFITALPVIGLHVVNELSLDKYACSSPHFKRLRDYDLTEGYERGKINSRGFY